MGKNRWLLPLMMAAGAIVGALIGELTRGVSFLQWLSYGRTLGVSVNDPFVLDLVFIQLKFGLTIDFTVASILCIAIALVLYRKYG